MQTIDLKVSLIDMPYPVIRHLRVPVVIRLSDLHQILQTAMPWDNSHLYDFTLGRSLRWAKRDRDDRGDTRDVRTETLADVLAELGRKPAFLYTYDMGDGWEHVITPGKPYDLPAGEAAVALLSAEGKCPPDDSGGAPGFERMVVIAADPSHDEHDDIVDWLGDDHPWQSEADTAALALAVKKAGARIAKKLGTLG